MYCLTSYASPIGLLTLGSDGKHLTGLWIQGQKYFGGENVGEIGKEQGPEPTVFGDVRKWLDRYFSGQKPCPDELPLAPEGTEFQKLISDPEQKEYVYGDSTTLLGKKFAKSQWAALWIFLGCVAIVAVFGATKSLRPVFGGKAMSMTLIIQMMMLTAGALMVIFCRTRAADVGKSSVFRAGAIAIAAVYGVAWMSDSLFQAHLPELKQALTGAVTSYPWLYAVVLLVVSKFVNSQAAAVAIILPVAVQVGVPTGIAVSMLSLIHI